MKIASVLFQGEQRVAVERDREWWLFESRPAGVASGVSGLIQQIVVSSRSSPGDFLLSERRLESVAESDIRFLAPLTTPGKVICIGKNYEDHAREMGSESPDLPIVFSKFASAIIGPGDPIVLPAISQSVDFEAELVVVIGRPGRHIRREASFEHVFGYTVGNDISARDWQKDRPGGQWLLGKTFDTFAPLGPWIVTADEIGNPHDLDIRSELNGKMMQHARTNQLIFPIDQLISHLSNFFRLEPGDLIFTGTPAGVGAGRKPPVFLKSGDELKVHIEKIGTLHNRVV